MKKVLGIGTALALLLSVAPVMADDNGTFHALSQITVQTNAAMSDDQLAAVEGQNVCVACFNLAIPAQANTAALVGVALLTGNANNGGTSGVSQGVSQGNALTFTQTLRQRR